MRIAVFSLMFMILIAMASLAQGLEITRVDAHVDYDDAYIYRIEQEQKATRRNSALVDVANGSKIDVDVFPGSNLTFTVTVENKFQGDEPILRDIFTKITIEGGSKGSDLKEENGNFDLEPGNDGKADVTFSIPFDINEGMHNVIIESEGEGKNHTFYKAEIRLKVNIKKLAHDLRVSKVSLSPDTVYCNRKVTLTAEISNAGSNLEREVALEFRVPSLNFDSYDRNIFLSSYELDDEKLTHTKTSLIEVPSFFKSGTYPVFVNLYWENFILLDQKTANLVVKDCPYGAKEMPKEANETVLIQPPENGVQKEIITATEEVSVFDSPAILSALLGGGFIIFIISILVIFGLLRRSRV